MKTLIIHAGRSGNTKKMAEAVYNALSGRKKLVSVTELPLQDYNYDLVILGFPIMAGRVEPRAARFLADFRKRTKLLLFMTHGSRRDSALVASVMKQAEGLVSGPELVGRYSSRGEVDSKVLYKLGKSSKPPEWLKEADGAKGHPDTDDIEGLIALVKKNSGSGK